MSISEAAGNYHAAKKGNCAQSVVAGYAEIKGEKGELIEQMKRCGGGNAPEGYCGALYAAMVIVGDEKKDQCIELFKQQAKGCSKCKEIRPNGIITCNQCVRNAGKCIEDLI